VTYYKPAGRGITFFAYSAAFRAVLVHSIQYRLRGVFVTAIRRDAVRRGIDTSGGGVALLTFVLLFHSACFPPFVMTGCLMFRGVRRSDIPATTW